MNIDILRLMTNKLKPMKSKFILYVNILLMLLMFVSCKEKDERDTYIGTWSGHLVFERIGTEYYTTEVITKSPTKSNEIIITDQGNSSSPRIANVNGTNYTYQVFASTLGISGNYAGSGNIDGNIMTESGTISSDSDPYPGYLGKWYKTLTRQ
jgi:hypothetical protein